MSDQQVEKAFDELRSQLQGAAPEGLRELTPAQLRLLTAAIADARHRQAEALAIAGDRALGHIPRLLRAPIRRVVR